MKGERASETKIVTKLFALLSGAGKFKNVFKGESIKGKGIGEVLRWDGIRAPWAMTVPDLIVASDNYHKAPDEVFLLAIETKYFARDASSGKQQWRQRFREIGQPLRDLLYGFDAAVLWHLFAEPIDDEEIAEYTGMCHEVIEKLKLPFVYFATKITEQSQFAFFRPWRLEKTLSLSDINHIAACFLQINAERAGPYRAMMNPLLRDEKVARMRKAVKAVLRIP